MCAYVDGQPVLDMWGGVRDETGAPWQRETACTSFSTTKGITATALHILADRGLIDYDRPVSVYWPEFARSGKAAITVRDVLCHRSGLFDCRALVDDARQLLDWEYMVSALADAAPAIPPGNSTAYQALTWGFLVGELIRRVSGLHVPEFVQAELALPLGLDGLYIGADGADLADVARLIDSPARLRQHRASDRDAATASSRARQHARSARRKRLWTGIESLLRRVGHPIDLQRAASALAPPGISRLDFSSEDVMRACIPAANGVFTARSLARVYAALATGGQLDGVRLLSPETLERATEIQGHGYDQVTILNMHWRLGYHRLVTLRGVPPRAFGHFGWGGSGAWADPQRNASFAFVVNTGFGTPIGDLRITRLSTALLACLRRRSHA